MPGEKYSSFQIGGAAWRQVVMNRARRCSDQIATFVQNEFDTDTSSGNIITGLGTVTYDTGQRGGVARCKTGAIAGSAGVYNAGASALIESPQDESWYIHSRVWQRDPVPGGGAADTAFIGIQLRDIVTGPGLQFIAFGLYGPYSTTHLSLVMDAGGGEVATVTDVPEDLLQFRELGIGRDAVDDKLYVEVEDTRVLELDGPFADLTSNPCFFFSGATGPLLADIELWVDRQAAVIERT